VNFKLKGNGILFEVGISPELCQVLILLYLIKLTQLVSHLISYRPITSTPSGLMRSVNTKTAEDRDLSVAFQSATILNSKKSALTIQGQTIHSPNQRPSIA